MKIAFLTQTRKENLEECQSIISIINGIVSSRIKNNIYLIANHQVDQVSKKNNTKISKHDFFKVIQTSKQSLSKARNILIEYSLKNFKDADFLITIDDDVEIPNLLDFFNTMQNYIKKYGDFDFGCISIFFKNTNRCFSRHAQYTLRKRLEPFIMSLKDHNLVLGSGIIFNKKILNEGIRFDTNLGLGAKYGGSEETDIFFYALENKYNCIYFTNLIIFHPILKKDHYGFLKMISYGKGRGLVYKKHFNKNKFFFTKTIFISLISNALGMIYSLAIFNKNAFSNQSGLLLGKLLGLFI